MRAAVTAFGPVTRNSARHGEPGEASGPAASQAEPPALDCAEPTPTATERLAQFIHDIDPTKLPSAVREQATLCVLDALGIALAGMSEPSARAARAVARNAGGPRSRACWSVASGSPRRRRPWSTERRPSRTTSSTRSVAPWHTFQAGIQALWRPSPPATARRMRSGWATMGTCAAGSWASIHGPRALRPWSRLLAAWFRRTSRGA